MPRRKSDDTAPPTEPAKPGHDPSLTWRPLVMSRWVAPNTPSTGSAEPDAPPPDDSPLSDSSWKKVDEELGRRIRGIGPQYVGLPPWSHRALQAAKARIQSSPASLTRREKERFDFLRQWQRQEIEDAAARRERAIEARELWQQEREQERRTQEQQERERQARRVRELERKMREHKRQALELKRGLETVRALAEAAGDEKTRLAIVRTALAEIARSGREKRAEKLETDPWRICARRAILAAIEGNPALNNTDLTDKVVEGLKTDKIRGRSRRQIERVITDMRDGGIIPPPPPR